MIHKFAWRKKSSYIYARPKIKDLLFRMRQTLCQKAMQKAVRTCRTFELHELISIFNELRFYFQSSSRVCPQFDKQSVFSFRTHTETL